MKLLKTLFVTFGLVAATAFAAERGSKDEAKSLTDAAVAHVAKVGWDKAKVDFTDKANADWHKKDLYVFAVNGQGVVQAHGGNEKMVGKDLIAIKDGNGREWIKEMIATAAKGPGWVEYAWQHPETKKVEDKVSYVRRLPNSDVLLGVGAYK